MRQQGLLPEVAPEDDLFVNEIIERFGGYISSIVDAPEDWENSPRVWATTVRPRVRRTFAPRPDGRPKGRPIPKQCDFTVTVHNRSQAKNGVAIHPWELVWSGSLEPLHVGLFESERAALDYTARRRS
jgi:hypothetical protein